MNPQAPQIKGWCPGALRPMPTGDGLLARVRPRAGRLSLDQLETIADIAKACGNGVIEISSRGNIQLRGVREAALSELWDRLARADLLDADPEVERLRNIVCGPLSDIDPETAGEVASVTAALETRLASEPSLRALPPKFSFVIDSGGRWPLGDVDADIRFEARDGRFLASLAGDAAAVELSRERIPDVGARLAKMFVERAQGPEAPRRMRALVRRDGAAALFAAAGFMADVERGPLRAATPREAVGVLKFATQSALGLAPPLGRANADAFASLARAARSLGVSGVRPTPWRSMVFVGLNEEGAEILARVAAGQGFIESNDDPRLGVVACPGAPACGHSHRDTTLEALMLSTRLGGQGGVVLHVSGCAKGCARAAPTPITLVATAQGYDAVLGGRASDEPERRGLDLAAAIAFIEANQQGLAA